MKHQHTDSCACFLSAFLKSTALGLAVFLMAGVEARATTYPGNGATGFGGPIGKGTLTLTDDGTNIYGTLTNGNGASLNDCLVIYIDNGMGGGFNSTLDFTDDADPNRKSISGYDGTHRSVMTFMTNFNPQYAIALFPNNGTGGFTGLWTLKNNGTFPFIANVSNGPLTVAGPNGFLFAVTDIGLTQGTKASIKIFGTLISDTAFRSDEAIAGNDSGTDGNNPFTQTGYGVYIFDGGPSVPTPVAFFVDMTAMTANGAFVPSRGDTVNAAGTFQSTAWSGFQLTNTPMGGNTNIYSGTYLDANPAGTPEQFKFTYISNGLTSTNTYYEDSDNRPFVVQSGAQTNATVYFSDLAGPPSATTNYVTFQVDMSYQIAVTNFNPATELIEVYGTFDQTYTATLNPQVNWAPGNVMTNNPSASNPNLYTLTLPDGNYPGSWEQYKFVIVNPTALTTNYESINNRDFYTPTNSGALSAAYFNNAITVPITFQVDMTVPAEAGDLSTNGTTVDVSGSWQNPPWSGGALTNNPNAANTNIYTGTILIPAPPGTEIQYKFTYVTSGNQVFEEPASTGGGNRFFIQSTAQTMPLVYWSDENANDFLPAATQVTFTVQVTTNTVDKNGVLFNPNTDAVFIDGDFLPGGWNNNLWTDTDPGADFTDPSLQMVEVGLSDLYTNTFTVAAGTDLEVSYKYAIQHNASAPNTGSIDDEAPPNENHTRYIRAVGAYSMPVDTFGSQTNNPPTGNEIAFGNLTVSNAPDRQIALNWLGLPGVYLQSCTNLAQNVWITFTNTGGGLSATNLPSGGSNIFFRLVNPYNP
jgi:hypothetical protein